MKLKILGIGHNNFFGHSFGQEQICLGVRNSASGSNIPHVRGITGYSQKRVGNQQNLTTTIEVSVIHHNYQHACLTAFIEVRF